MGYMLTEAATIPIMTDAIRAIIRSVGKPLHGFKVQYFPKNSYCSWLLEEFFGFLKIILIVAIINLFYAL